MPTRLIIRVAAELLLLAIIMRISAFTSAVSANWPCSIASCEAKRTAILGRLAAYTILLGWIAAKRAFIGSLMSTIPILRVLFLAKEAQWLLDWTILSSLAWRSLFWSSSRFFTSSAGTASGNVVRSYIDVTA